MSVVSWQSNASTWLQPGRQAARAGRTGEALESILVLLGMLVNAAEVITKNQSELDKAIQKISTQRR